MTGLPISSRIGCNVSRLMVPPPRYSLGPLLFIIYVNDLEKAARNALMAAFADDTRLSKAIRGEATEEDMFLLSMDLHRVISLALANNMELNESKFDLLCYSYRV